MLDAPPPDAPVGADARPWGDPPEPAEAAPEALPAVLFRAGGVLFAVRAESVAGAHRERGKRPPAFDLGAEIDRPARRNLVLALRAGGAHVRLSVDEVLEVASLPLESIHALPRLAAQRQRGGYVLGLAVRGDDLAVLLDVDALARSASAAGLRPSETDRAGPERSGQSTNAAVESPAAAC